ncbi:carboxymuconolactone decarboxylase family protein [Neobacillus vireti]|uniref:Carboxymuconolactone decarboxylase n=1 Tax=Neobacillus vireti LMG 21834 TaxID=1131730 RepID=A0AB94IPI9_9BACI|nr:carboxymuconolactone decarboxylase family protein [Neobacillus vireti]ETI69006.1 carboxymuconolactone decarboxylase [Neobacillus vireti LMG 21834]KLT15704.1 gamma-carboxymuconolactone decarboxylase [Neobacillus vireti]
MTQLTNKQRELKEKFIAERGYWADFWEDTLRLNEDFFEKYIKFSAVPWKKGTLDPKVKELIYVAIDASTTHLYSPGTQAHMQNAIRYGATPEEIMEVFMLTSVLGIHTCTSGIPILVDELKNAGVELNEELTVRQEKLKEQFKEARGYWSELWDQFLLLDDEFFEAYLEFSSVPWNKGTLEPKVKEFIYIAIDAATTHLYDPGTRVHIKNALKYGATKEEIMEVFQLVSVLGIHTCLEGVPILVEEMKKMKVNR